MKMKNSIIGLSLFTILVLSGCIKKSMEPEIKIRNYEEKQNNSSQNKELQNLNNIKLKVVRYDTKDNNIPLPVSTQACVGDKCKANIFENEKNMDNSTKRNVKPFLASVKKRVKPIQQNRIESVYDDNIYMASNYAYKKYKKQNLVSHRTIKPYSYASNKTSIQVGAFRRYAGAKIYAKRYSLLSSRYKTIIKKDMLYGKPIYRVRIKGFKNKREARRFMSRYSLSGAFLVRR
jgi:hypothetical protein